jgi:hypothetical protein
MNTEDISNKALKEAAKNLTPQFQKEAINAGWTSDVVMQMTVEEQNGDLYINYPQEIAQKVDELEYGTPTSPPNPAIRKFMSSYSEGTEDVFEKVFEDISVDLGAFN